MARKSDEEGNEFGGREKYVSRNASQFQRLGYSLIIKVPSYIWRGSPSSYKVEGENGNSPLRYSAWRSDFYQRHDRYFGKGEFRCGTRDITMERYT